MVAETRESILTEALAAVARKAEGIVLHRNTSPNARGLAREQLRVVEAAREKLAAALPAQPNVVQRPHVPGCRGGDDHDTGFCLVYPECWWLCDGVKWLKAHDVRRIKVGETCPECGRVDGDGLQATWRPPSDHATSIAPHHPLRTHPQGEVDDVPIHPRS